MIFGVKELNRIFISFPDFSRKKPSPFNKELILLAGSGVFDDVVEEECLI